MYLDDTLTDQELLDASAEQRALECDSLDGIWPNPWDDIDG